MKDNNIVKGQIWAEGLKINPFAQVCPKITINVFELYYQELQLSFALKLYHHCHTKPCLF